jgi:hypothetical protein
MTDLSDAMGKNDTAADQQAAARAAAQRMMADPLGAATQSLFANFGNLIAAFNDKAMRIENANKMLPADQQKAVPLEDVKAIFDANKDLVSALFAVGQERRAQQVFAEARQPRKPEQESAGQKRGAGPYL